MLDSLSKLGMCALGGGRRGKEEGAKETERNEEVNER
jgi:hypothetical protein